MLRVGSSDQNGLLTHPQLATLVFDYCPNAIVFRLRLLSSTIREVVDQYLEDAVFEGAVDLFDGLRDGHGRTAHRQGQFAPPRCSSCSAVESWSVSLLDHSPVGVDSGCQRRWIRFGMSIARRRSFHLGPRLLTVLQLGADACFHPGFGSGVGDAVSTRQAQGEAEREQDEAISLSSPSPSATTSPEAPCIPVVVLIALTDTPEVSRQRPGALFLADCLRILPLTAAIRPNWWAALTQVHLRLLNDVQRIPAGFCYEAPVLVELRIGGGVSLKQVGNNFVANARLLKSVIFEGPLSNLEVIGDSFCFNCSSLTSFRLPHDCPRLWMIGNRFLSGCSSLMEVFCGGGYSQMQIRLIGTHFLGGCTSLRKCHLQNCFTVMPLEDFESAHVREVFSRISWFSMVSLQQPSDVRLSQFMFRDCVSLTEIDLSGIRGRILVDPNPFPNCPSLQRIRVHSDAVLVNSSIVEILRSRECDPTMVTSIEIVGQNGDTPDRV